MILSLRRGRGEGGGRRDGRKEEEERNVSPRHSAPRVTMRAIYFSRYLSEETRFAVRVPSRSLLGRYPFPLLACDHLFRLDAFASFTMKLPSIRLKRRERNFK